MRHVPLTALDGYFLHMETGAEPWNSHLEVRVEGRLDAERLMGAIRTGMARHPLARARLVEKEADARYQWEIPDRCDDVPLEIVDCRDDAEVIATRNRLQSVAVRLDTSPPFIAVLVHHPGGDYLMLNLHHAVVDGLGAIHFMTSVLRAYADQQDPISAVDPLAVRDLRALTGSPLADRKIRMKVVAEFLQETSTPVRIAARGESEQWGYGIHLTRLGREQTAVLIARRRPSVTVNDLLLAALAMTIRRWNERHGGERGRITMMMPVNLRPAEWQQEVFGNFVSCVSVSLAEEAQADLDAAIGEIAERTRRLKTEQSAGVFIDLLDPSALPEGLRRRMPANFSPLTWDRPWDTAVVSNLGRVAEFPHLGEEAGSVREIWLTPPCHMPMGASFAIASMAGEMFLGFRYRHALFDAKAAAEFCGLYEAILTQG
jgi:NRPS condensation-like uncharacterized protein